MHRRIHCLVTVFILLAATAHAANLSNLDVMNMFNEGDTLLKTSHVIEVRVNDDLLGPERLVVSKKGYVRSRYAGVIYACNLTPRQLAQRIRKVVMSRKCPPGLQLPEFIQVDPLVRIVFVGTQNYSCFPSNLDEVDPQTAIGSCDLIAVRPASLIPEYCSNGAKHADHVVVNVFDIECRFLPIAGLSYRAATVKLREFLMAKSGGKVAGLQVFVCPTPISEPPLWIKCDHGETVTIFGNVGIPGKVLVSETDWRSFSPRDLTVSNMIKIGGGLISRRLPTIQIVRNTPRGPKRIVVNTKAILIDHNPEYDLFVRPRDVIIVE